MDRSLAVVVSNNSAFSLIIVKLTVQFQFAVSVNSTRRLVSFSIAEGYLSNKTAFLWFSRRNNPRGMLREHEKNLSITCPPPPPLQPHKRWTVSWKQLFGPVISSFHQFWERYIKRFRSVQWTLVSSVFVGLLLNFAFLIQGNYVACLVAMLQLMDETHYQQYVAHFPTDQDLLVSLNSWCPHKTVLITLSSRTRHFWHDLSLQNAVLLSYKNLSKRQEGGGRKEWRIIIKMAGVSIQFNSIFFFTTYIDSYSG